MERNQRTIRNIMLFLAWTLAIASFLMLGWLVRQQHANQLMMTQILRSLREAPPQAAPVRRPIRKTAADMKASAPSAPQTSANADRPKLPKDAESLLRKAEASLIRARKLARKGNHRKAASLIPSIKKQVWTAGDMLNEKQRKMLRKLMGPLDYSRSQLLKGEQGDLVTPIRTVKEILNGRKQR